MRGENDDDEAREVLDESWFASLLEAAAAKKPISAAIATAKVRLHAFNEEGVRQSGLWGDFAPRVREVNHLSVNNPSRLRETSLTQLEIDWSNLENKLNNPV